MIRIEGAPTFQLHCDSWAELIEGIGALLPLPVMREGGKPYPTDWLFYVDGTPHPVTYSPGPTLKLHEYDLSAANFSDVDLSFITGMHAWRMRFAFNSPNYISHHGDGQYVWAPGAIGMEGRGEKVIRFVYGTDNAVNFSRRGIGGYPALKASLIENGWTSLEPPPPPPAQPGLIVGALYTSVKAQFLMKRLEVKPNAH